MNSYVFFLIEELTKNAHKYAVHAGKRLTTKDAKACQLNISWCIERCIKVADIFAASFD